MKRTARSAFEPDHRLAPQLRPLGPPGCVRLWPSDWVACTLAQSVRADLSLDEVSLDDLQTEEEKMLAQAQRERNQKSFE